MKPIRTCATPHRRAGILTSVLALTFGLVPFAIPRTADAQNEVTIWSATLTPRQYQSAPTATGYGYHSIFGGSLSDTDFVYRGTTYTIRSLQLEWVYGGIGYWRAGMLFDGQELPAGGCTQSIARFYSNGTDYTGSNTNYGIRNLSNNPRPPWNNGTPASVSITVQPVEPDAPTELRQFDNDTQAMLLWLSSECDGGSDVTRHEYRLKEVGEASFGDWTSIPSSAANEANANSYTVSYTDSSKEYVFEVRAVNAQGEGPFSDPSRIDSLDGTVCTRTAEVRDAIVAATPWMSCGDVTAGDLAAIRRLLMGGRGITALAAGDFDGLTALTRLGLNNNSLSTLPAGVFDELTALTELDLGNNPGAPFSPTADALPDDGTVVDAGGDVTLDGSGSGGPWGTNVTYSWALTSPTSGVTVTFDDAASATPVVTIPALAEGTELTFTLTVTGRATNTSYGSAPDTDTATVTAVVDPTAGICGRTKQVRDAIVGEISGVTHCADVTDAHLGAITGTLDLRSDGITALASGDFAGLTALEDLYLDNNGLTALDAGDFAELTALDVLRLGDNELTTLPTGVFAGLTTLRELYLHNNELSTLPDDVFEPLTALTRLYLNSNELTALPAGVFDGLTSLEYLELPDNGLTTLDAGVFDGLTLLISLVLSDNELATLPDDVFEPLIRLLRLNLSNNSGEPFAPTADALPDDGTFLNAGGTVTLDGSGSDGGPWGTNVTYSWALTDPASGVTVMFDDTAIATPEVTIPALTPVTDLTFTLTVTGRGGTVGIDPATDTATVTAVFDPTAGICGRTEAVRNAILGGISGINNCAAVTAAHLAAITGSLGLQNITSLAAGDFDGLTSLTLVFLEFNELTTLPAGVFDGLTSLQYLGLGNNELSTLPAGVFDELTALTELSLHYNELTELPAGVFDGLTSLTTLDLGRNSLATLPAGVFDELTALTTLHLTNNELATLPAGVFDELTALTTLGLQGNLGAPFSPTADALPDDGTVVDAGGDVTLDGSGSGGPWGTNVTYSWALTSPTSGVTVTFDDAASATPVVTIPALAEGTELTFTLTVTGRATDPTDGSAPATDTATVTAVVDPTAGICGRTKQVRDAIVARISGVVSCADVTDTQLAAITGTLDLRLDGITALAAVDFNGLTALTALELRDNSLSTLPAGVFDGLTALTTLNLFNTSLSTLPAGVFDGLTALDRLLLHGNSLSTLPAGVFDGLTALTNLELGVNSLSTLPAGVFDGLTALTTLRLDHNSLSTLPVGVFDELTALTRLDLRDNSLSTLPARVFDGLTALTDLSLRDNSLSTLPAGVFDGLTALQELNLRDNSLSTLPAGVFDGLTALQELLLRDNSLSTLPAGVFDGLTALTALELQGNLGAPFSPTADALPDDGTVVDAGGDVTLDGSGSGGPWGTNVTYSWALTSPTSGVTVTFDDAASATPEVTIPALTAGTELTFTLTVTGRSTNASWGSAPDTDTATVTAVFDATAGICGRTEEVRDAIVGEISGVTHCALVTDAHLAAITGTLRLGAENITTLAAGDFDGLTALTTLRLRGNSLSTLPAGVFDGLTALTNLELGRNSLSTLTTGVFDELTALTTLDLRTNSLSTLPAGVFDKLTALTTLDLRNNSLSTLPAGVFDELTALTTLRLEGSNPGAPFSPTADALPDDGEVSFAGGDVTLDGSGSDGGPWGTNVTYSWAASGAAVTFDDAASATPVVTIPALAEGTELTFTLTVTGRATSTSHGSAPATDTATVTAVFDPTAGICGRTEQVRDAIVAPLVSGVTHCALVTDAHLAAITGDPPFSDLSLGRPTDLTALAAGDFDGLTALRRLELGSTALTTLPAGVFDELTALTYLGLSAGILATLPAGVFDELTALTRLSLFSNALTTLPAGVFDELTALTSLDLSDNSLSTLPAGVFDELTALTSLDLSDNSLSTLPAGVFEELTSLTQLRLQDNLGAPFSPTAVALPDDGEVLVGPGGTVTLDGSDGGPWGTNVTYRWRHISGAPGGGTFDDRASATPVVTIPALAAGAELTFELTVTPRAHRGNFSNGFDTDTDTATVTAAFDATAGICGRTQQVRDGIVGKISGVASCALVTDAHLAAIGGSLDLNNKGITALAAGDFDGLTALNELRLKDNSLSTLPAGVFDGLTALTQLRLGNNSLSTLPAGVFDELTALKWLELEDNSLSTLPDDVFEDLTALTGLLLQGNDLSTLPAGVFEELTALTQGNLRLQDNPGAPFSPTADAVPDDGEVPVAGGDVTLDGSGSGGPWGTNVTYSWALTSPTSGVTVTFDDAASATPVVTIPALADGAELTFTLTVTGRGGTNGIDPATDTAMVTAAILGICGRTEAVRDGIVRLFGNITHCADITDAHLAAITGSLDLRNDNITALAAGDFDGLTALTTLNLGSNSLTTLPAGVFDGLTALTGLYLGVNSLETLPAGVFNELTALTDLLLNNNELSSLPDDVFEELTALTTLQLQRNPGAPFSPTADARPDDGEVSSAGGTVTLDGSGSGSGGAWGTNVTYVWALTTPASGTVFDAVTFDDDTSATPVVTIPALTAGTELTFTLTVTGRATNASRGSAPDTDTAMVTATASNDAKLGDLAVNDGTNDLDLTPPFASGTFAYAADVANAVDEVTLTATLSHTGASVSAVTLNGTGIVDSDFTDGIAVPSLLVGDNEIVVTVTAQDDATTQPYTLTLARAEAIAVTVSFEHGTYTVAEGGTEDVKVKLSADPERTVTIALTAIGQDGADADDYSVGSSAVTFNSGEMEKIFSFTATQDSVDDDGESVKLGFLNLPTGVTAGSTNEATVSITDDDLPPAVQVPGDVSVTEGAGTAQVAVGLSAASGKTVTVNWATADDSAVAGSDYTAASGTLTFDPGVTSMTITVAILDDGVPEPQESLDVILSNAANATLPAHATVAVTIGNDDGTAATGKPAISGTAHARETLTASTGTIMDDDGLINVAYSYQWIRVAGSVETDISGETGSTYVVLTADVGNKVKVAVSFTDDAGNAEALTSDAWPQSGTIGALIPLEVGWETINKSYAEDEESPEIAMVLHSGAPVGNASIAADLVLVPITANDDPADGNQDYVWGVDSTPLVIPPGGTRAVYTVQFLDDDVVENIERFRTELSNVRFVPEAGAVLEPGLTVTLSPSEGQVTIFDNDITTTYLEHEIIDVVEGVGSVEIRQILGPKQVEYSFTSIHLTISGEAENGPDFVGYSRTVDLEVLAAFNSTWLEVVDDDLPEGYGNLNDLDFSVEALSVTLLRNGVDPNDVTILNARTQVNIEDDDPAFYVPSGIEGKGAVDVPIRLSYPVRREVSIDYRVMSGETAVVSGTAVFAIGSTEFIVAVPSTLGHKDGIVLSSPSAGRIYDPGAALQSAELIADEFEFAVSIVGGAELSALALTDPDDANVGYALTPAFDAAVDTYTAAVPSGVDAVKLSATADDSGASVSIANDDDTGTADEAVLDLAEGSNVLSVTVTAADPATVETYTVTVTRAAGPPGRVTGLAVTPGDGRLAAVWEEVADATGYKVQWKSGSETFAGAAADSREAVIASGATLSHAITGLSNGTAYTVRVIATKTGAADGPASEEVTETPSLPELTIGDATATEGSAVAFTVTLSRVASSSVTVEYSAAVEAGDTATLDASAPGGADFTAASGTLTVTAGSTTGTVSIATAGDTTHEDDETFTVTLTSPAGATLAGASTAQGTIVDDDSPPAVQVPGDVSVTEGAGVTAPLAVGLSAASGKTVTVNWATADDSAVAGSDYTAASGTLTFDPGVTSMTITVAILDDGVAEPQESLDVILSNAASATLPAHATVAVTIGNDDGTAATGKPAISGTAQARETLTASTGDILDDDGLSGVVYRYQWVRVAGAVETDIPDATGRTYVVLTADVGNKVKVAVSFTDDAGNAEALTSDAWPQIGTVAASVALEVGWEETDYDYAEDAGSPEIAMVLHSGDPVGNASIAADLVLEPITANDDPADGNQDYVWGVESTPLVIPPGGTRAVYAVQLLDDGLVENIERFRVRLTNVRFVPEAGAVLDPGLTVTLSPSEGQVSILDNDITNTWLEHESIDVGEGVGSVEIRQIVGPEGVEYAFVTVHLAISGEAVGGTDYAPHNDFVEFAALATDSSSWLEVVDDDLPEGYEDLNDLDFSVEALSVTLLRNGLDLDDVNLLNTKTRVNITDDDPAFYVPSGIEGKGAVDVPIKLSYPVPREVSIDYRVMSGETAVVSGTAVFAIGSTEFIVAVPSTLGLKDGIVLSNPSAGRIYDPGAALQSAELIADEFEFAVSIVGGAELSALALTDAHDNPIGLTPAAFDPVTLAYTASVANGVASVTVTPTPGDGNAAVAYMPSDSDLMSAGHQVALSVGVNTIEVEVTAEDGNSTATYTVTVTRALGQVTGVALTVGSGQLKVDWTAVTGADGYKVQWRSGGETFAAASAEGREAVVASGATTTHTITGLANGTAYTVRVMATKAGLADGPASGEETQTPALPELTIEDATATEGAGVAFTVTLSRAAADEVTVEYTTSDGTGVGGAEAGTDYTAASGLTLTFGASTTSATLTIATTPDTTDENDETFTVTLASPSTNAKLGSAQTATGTIVDDDGTPTVSIEDAMAEEGVAVEFTVNLSHASSGEVTVQYTTSNGTAMAGDYTAAANRTLSITAGETSATLTIATTEDTEDEEDETFTVTLASPSSNAALGARRTATGTIVDDDLSADATLSALALTDPDDANVGYVLTPAFDAAIDTYTASVASGVTAVTVTPELADENATFSYVPSVDSDTGSEGHQMALLVGENPIEVEVTAEDGNSTETYTVTVTRALGQVTGESLTPGAGRLTVGWSAVTGADGYKVQWKSGMETFAAASAEGREAVIGSGTTTTTRSSTWPTRRRTRSG